MSHVLTYVHVALLVVDGTFLHLSALSIADHDSYRLGPGGGQHTQPSLLPSIKPDSEGMFTAISLGQDHTLALTADGTVCSWGLGRFSQLGYELASPHIQSTPRVIAGPLRRERVRGIAACKSASACWTDTLLYTWGKNNGQLGYDRNTSPAQPIPRIVTKITKPVISIALNVSVELCNKFLL